MHIVLDARKLNDGGIGTYIRNLISGLAAVSQHRVTAICSTSESEPNFPDGVEVVQDSSPLYSFSEYFLMPLRLRQLISAADIFHSPHFTLPYFLTAPSVVTIHDTILLDYPRRAVDAKVARFLISSALRRADRIITVSKTSRERILSIWPGVGEKLRVVCNAPRPSLMHGDDSRTATASYFLFIGSERAHKGFDRLLDAWRILKGKLGASSPKLIAVGKEFDLSRQAVRGSELEPVVSFKGDVSELELDNLLRNAKFLLMPSLEEGFGLPVIEALAVGTPVICSDILVFRELFPKGTIFVNNQTGSGFAEAVEALLNESDKRDLLSREGRAQSSEYSVQKHVAETIAIYQECLR